MAIAAEASDMTTVMTTVPYEFDEGAVNIRIEAHHFVRSCSRALGRAFARQLDRR